MSELTTTKTTAPPLPSPAPEIDTTQYRKDIERLAELKSEEVFKNASAEHAAIIFATFFKFAKERVVIFCRDLASPVFDDPTLVKELENALKRTDRAISISIITQEPPKSNILAQKIAQWRSEKLPISLKTTDKSMAASRLEENFAVMDSRAYRFEPKRDILSAFASMNNPGVCKNLLGLFNALDAAIPAVA